MLHHPSYGVTVARRSEESTSEFEADPSTLCSTPSTLCSTPFARPWVCLGALLVAWVRLVVALLATSTHPSKSGKIVPIIVVACPHIRLRTNPPSRLHIRTPSSSKSGRLRVGRPVLACVRNASGASAPNPCRNYPCPSPHSCPMNALSIQHWVFAPY